ncbi:MAG TPA: hypothetical protein VGI90_19350 [Steroidobacteraceae bacterium]|jgi:hypothetical protein
MRIATRSVLRLACIFLGAACTLAAVARPTNIQELVQDTQRMSQGASHMTMVWWIPQEFWEASLDANPRVTPAQRDEVLAALEDLQIVALLRGKVGIGGFTDASTLDDMVAHARFELNGKVIEPLEDAKIGVGAQAVLSTLKPLIGGMLGQFGKGMQFVAYPSKQGSQRLIDPKKPGSFDYTFFDESFHWRLPLASLLPKKIDPKTKEEFPGNFDFNPYTGGKLSSQ